MSQRHGRRSRESYAAIACLFVGCLLVAAAIAQESAPLQAAVATEETAAGESAPVGEQAHSAEQAHSGEQVARIARLISELGAESQSRRDRATAELARLGDAPADALRRAAASLDSEVSLRARELLAEIAVERLWRASQVSGLAGRCATASALGVIREQTGNTLLVGTAYGTLNDVEVQLGDAQGAFWPLMDELCRQSGNRVRPHYDTRAPGLIVTAGEPGRNPLAYAGPLRAQITSARRVFIEEVDYEKLASDLKHTFQLNLQVMWEDRFRLVAYRTEPQLVEARTDTFVALSAAQQAAGGWSIPNAGTRQVTLSLRLAPPPATACELSVLRLTWGVVAVGDLATIEVDELEPPVVHRQDDVELTVESIESRSSGRYDVTLLVNRGLVLPEPQEVLYQENEIELYDAAGQPFRKEGQSNSLSAAGARLKVTFRGASAESAPARLVLTYPRIRSERDVEIVFRNVPLPVARLE